jgi:hypothetical protein
MDAQWITVKEAAARIGVEPQIVGRYIRQRLLTHRNVSSGNQPRYLVLLASVEAFIQSRTIEAKSINDTAVTSVHSCIVEPMSDSSLNPPTTSA